MSQVASFDVKFTLKISEIFLLLGRTAQANKIEIPDNVFSYDSLRVLSIIYATILNAESLTTRISTVEIARKLSNTCSRQKVARIIKRLATWGFINTDTLDWKLDKVQRESTLMSMNPNVEALLTCKISVRDRNDTLLQLAKNGAQKAELSEIDSKTYQGFTFIHEYGYPEALKYKIYNFSRSSSAVDEFLDDKRSLEEIKKDETKLWRKNKDSFVEQCAKVWVTKQEQHGRGTDMPLWGLKSSFMNASAKNEARQLGSIVQEVGGGAAALLWFIFCSGVPEKDANGNIKFDIASPWRTCVFTDKRPTQFVKNVQSIIKDKLFFQYAGPNWETTREQLTEWFTEEMLDLEPRDGITKDKIGFALGDSYTRPKE